MACNDLRKRNFDLIMILSNPICHDTQPLFSSLSSIVPTGAVILFVVFVTLFKGVKKSFKFYHLAMHGHVGF